MTSRAVFMARPPSNFSWVSDSVAGFAFPYSKDEVKYLSETARLSHVITMCHEIPDAVVQCQSIKHHHLPVEDFEPADLSVIKKAIDIIKSAESNSEKVGVHCQLGQGRAGTILACYLAYKYGYDGMKAIKELRKMRPGSVCGDQECAVKAYAKFIKQ